MSSRSPGFYIGYGRSVQRSTFQLQIGELRYRMPLLHVAILGIRSAGVQACTKRYINIFGSYALVIETRSSDQENRRLVESSHGDARRRPDGTFNIQS